LESWKNEVLATSVKIQKARGLPNFLGMDYVEVCLQTSSDHTTARFISTSPYAHDIRNLLNISQILSTIGLVSVGRGVNSDPIAKA
jgi:hypothetical protein